MVDRCRRTFSFFCDPSRITAFRRPKPAAERGGGVSKWRMLSEVGRPCCHGSSSRQGRLRITAGTPHTCVDPEAHIAPVAIFRWCTLLVGGVGAQKLKGSREGPEGLWSHAGHIATMRKERRVPRGFSSEFACCGGAGRTPRVEPGVMFGCGAAARKVRFFAAPNYSSSHPAVLLRVFNDGDRRLSGARVTHLTV